MRKVDECARRQRAVELCLAGTRRTVWSKVWEGLQKRLCVWTRERGLLEDAKDDP